jgi:hypothetical protein
MATRYCPTCEIVEDAKIPLRNIYIRVRRPVIPANHQSIRRATWGKKQRFNRIGKWCAWCGFHLDERGQSQLVEDILHV